jgi:hypothetical protein
VRVVAALLTVMVLAGCERGQPPPLASVIPLIPNGTIDQVTQFTWTSSLEGASYRLTVTDPGGVPLLIRNTPETRVIVERDQAITTFPLGGYSWYVEALDANGEVIATSRTQLFDVD